MDTSRYYFSNFIEDDDLSVIAVRAKQMMQQTEHIVNLFQINNNIIYGHSPRQALFLMQQNNKSIFSPGSSKESSPSSVKSYEEIKTPTKHNPGTSNMPRRCLPLEDAEKKEHHPSTSEFSTPVLRRKRTVQSVVEEILNPNFDKFRTRDEQLASKVGPGPGSQQSSPTTEITKMTTNLTMTGKEFGSRAKVVGGIDASSQKSPRPSVIVQTPPSLAIEEKELGSPAKVVGSIAANSQKSSHLSVSVHASPSLAIAEKEFGSPAKEVCNIKLENQESPRSAEITRLTSSLAVDDKDSRNLIGEEQMGGDSAINKDSPIPEENTRKSLNPHSTKKYEERIKTSEPAPSLFRNMLLGICKSPNPSKKYFISDSEGMETSEPALIRSETPSPVKRTKICSVPTFDTQWFAIPAKKDKIENSPEDSEANVSRMPDSKPNISPIETMPGIRRDDRKRKTLSPIKRGRTLFKSMPRVVNLECEEEMGVEVVDLEYGASPRTSRSKSADFRSHSPKESSIESPVHGESKTDSSPKTPERYLRPSERAIASGSSRNVSQTNSPGSDDDVFARKNPSESPSIAATATRERSGKLEYTAADIEANPMLLKATVLKFTTLLGLRDKSARNSFVNFQNFQGSINFISICVNNMRHIIKLIDASGKYSTEEFKEIFCDANAISLKLLNKLRSWKKEVDFDIVTFQKCFQQIEQLKAEYEPLFTNENEPAVIFAVVQVYESEMRAIWKKIDDMVMLGDSRRPLFAHLAHDVERLIKMLVKSLILVGILQAS